jgi:prevent-host-death family protein
MFSVMSKRVSATQARVHFGEILRAVQEDGETIVVERGGHAAAVILPIAAYERMGDEARPRDWRARIAALHGLWESGLARRRLPDAVEVIRKGREERDAHLDEILRR